MKLFASILLAAGTVAMTSAARALPIPPVPSAPSASFRPVGPADRDGISPRGAVASPTAASIGRGDIGARAASMRRDPIGARGLIQVIGEAGKQTSPALWSGFLLVGSACAA